MYLCIFGHSFCLSKYQISCQYRAIGASVILSEFGIIVDNYAFVFKRGGYM